MREVSSRALVRAWPAWLAGGLVLLFALGTAPVRGADMASVLASPTGVPTGPVSVASSLIPAVSVSRDLGAVPAGETLQFGILLNDPNAAAERQLNAALYAPGNRLYRRFLTPGQYAARFGTPETQARALRTYLASAGLTVTYQSPVGRYWLAGGQAAQIDSLFGTQIHRYQLGRETYWANNSAVRVPGDLGIQDVLLNDAMQAHTDSRRPKPGYVFPFGFPLITFGPSDLWGFYDAPSSNTGQGQQLAIIGWGTPAGLESDLRQYETEQGLPQVPSFRALSVGSPGSDTSGRAEWDLDEDASTGMAPGADAITFYMATDNGFGNLNAAIDAWVNDSGAMQASASFGACEDNPLIGAGNSVAEEEATSESLTLGKTLFASTGDTGFGCPLNLPVNVNGILISPVALQEMPASDPNVVAVGGTVVYPDPTSATAKRLAEHSWLYSGGGPSFFQQQPDYQAQAGLGGQVMTPCISDVAGDVTVPPNTCRGVPDVSIVSGDITIERYAIVTAGADSFEAGTSLSAPLWQGVWERIQAAAPTCAGLGFANKKIYPDAEGANGASDFNDILLGTNGLWTAAPGWDYVSGWGTPDVANLMQHLAGSKVPSGLNCGGSGGGTGGGGTGGGGGGNPGPPPPSDAACTPVWTDAAGDDRDPVLGLPGSESPIPLPAEPPGAQGANPQLDLLRGDMSLTADDQNLRVRLTIDDLSKTVPAPYQANDYFGYWNDGATTYFADAEVDTSGTVSYFYGTRSGTSLSFSGPVTGSFGSGKNGVVEIDVPLAKVGSPVPGHSLAATGGETSLLVGLPSTNNPTNPGSSTGSFLTVDESPADSNGNFTGRPYVVEETCSAPTVTVRAVSAREEQAFSGVVADVADPRTSDAASDLAAVIDWGDGTTSAGVIAGSSGSFTVSGGHSWAEEGRYPIAVLVGQPSDSSRRAGVGTGAASVADADSLAVKVLGNLRYPSGGTFSGVVASVTDSVQDRSANGLIAVIDWGDGSSGSATISGSGGSFSVSGSHTYSRMGPHTITVTVSDPGGASAQGTGQIKPGGTRS